MSKKQYIVEQAGPGTNLVLLYINGHLESREVVSDLSLETYVGCVENLGYSKAYYIPVLERRLERAYAAYREAVETLEKAKYYPLELDELETDMLMKLIGGWRGNR